MKEYLNNIISTIINIVYLAEFTLEFYDCPIVITYLIEITNILSSNDFKIWYYKYFQQAP